MTKQTARVVMTASRSQRVRIRFHVAAPIQDPLFYNEVEPIYLYSSQQALAGSKQVLPARVVKQL